MANAPLDHCREFLKDTIRQKIDFSQTDQHQGVPPPPLEKPYSPDAVRLSLPPVGQWQGIESIDLATAIGGRQSRRSFSPEPLTLGELSFLLWATQGMPKQDDGTVLRTVPSAGKRPAGERHGPVRQWQGTDECGDRTDDLSFNTDGGPERDDRNRHGADRP
jgi:hypothetical protein